MTTLERAALFGVSYLEQIEIEHAEPWVCSWAAKFGAGAGRIRTWLAEGRPSPTLSELAIVGDPALAAVARDVLARLPYAVACHVVENAIVKCGAAYRDASLANARGWVRASLVDCEKPLEIGVVVPDAAVFAHEVAHAWEMDLPRVRHDATARDVVRECGRQLIRAEGSQAVAIENAMTKERAADALAAAWGFAIDTTSGHHGERRRRRALADLQRSAEIEQHDDDRAVWSPPKGDA